MSKESLKAAKSLLKCKVNGKTVEREIDAGATLLSFLREDMALKGTKQGCGEGECGACVVLVDDKPVNSCLYMAVSAQGKEITTIEGIRGKDGGPHPIQQAYADEGGTQCGFCTPGFVVVTYALLKRNPNPTREEMAAALAGNICRCTGYERIFRSVEKAASVISGKRGK